MVVDVFVKFNNTLVFPDPAPPKLRLYKNGQEYQVNSDNNLFRLIYYYYNFCSSFKICSKHTSKNFE